MTVVCGLAVDRTKKIELADDIRWLEGENGFDGFLDTFLGHLVGAESINVDADGLWVADGVGKLHFATIGETSGNDVLCNVATHVGGAAIDFGWILS